VLSIIASSPTTIEPVLQAVVEQAGRLCAATLSSISTVEGADLVNRATAGGWRGGRVPRQSIGRTSATGLAVIERRTVHIDDLQSTGAEFEAGRLMAARSGARTTLAVPLLREGSAIGVITLAHAEVRPFTERQIALVETFADQAVIAIENARLFNELQERNREVTEALEREKATGEVLEIVSKSPTDLRPVGQAIAEAVKRLCQAGTVGVFLINGDYTEMLATDSNPEMQFFGRGQISRGTVAGRAVLEGRTISYQGLRSDFLEEFPDLKRPVEPPQDGDRLTTILGVPLMGESGPVGAILATRTREIRPFSDSDVALVETFARQAVIAIENARLFNELQESNREVSEALEVQTVMAEVLAIVAGAPADLAATLPQISAAASRLCDATQGAIGYAVDGTVHIWDSTRGNYSVVLEFNQGPGRQRLFTAAMESNRPVSVCGPIDEWADEYPGSAARSRLDGHDEMAELAVPIPGRDRPVGVIIVIRDHATPFTQRHVAMLEILADQAVIAIENARLFNELQERNREVTEALSREQATGEILRQISRAPEELNTTLTAISTAAHELCDADGANVWLVDGEDAVGGNSSARTASLASFNPSVPVRTPISGPWVHSMAIREGRTVVVNDVWARLEARGLTDTIAHRGNQRTLMAAPIIRDDAVLGSISVVRTEVRPFSAQDVALLESFADQAAIAIDNARLIRELRDSNHEVTEALDQQTAMAEVLSIIASSATDATPVLEAIAEHAGALCPGTEIAIQLVDGDETVTAAIFGADPRGTGHQLGQRRPFAGRLSGEVIRTGVPFNFAGQQQALVARFPGSAASTPRGGDSSLPLSVLMLPLLKDGRAIGTMALSNWDAVPFSDSQVAVMQAFADQAVIAIENARLFNELQESNREVTEALEQQTAMAEVLSIIASSATDATPVLDAIVSSALKLFDSHIATIWQAGDGVLNAAAMAAKVDISQISRTVPIDRTTVAGRAFLDRKPVQLGEVTTLSDEDRAAFSTAVARHERSPQRFCLLGAPLLREGQSIGVLVFTRLAELGQYGPAEVALAQTFADQAVIAIENARLFNELQEKTTELVQANGMLELASQHKSDFLANMSHELRTPLNAIIGYAELLQEECTDLGDEDYIPDLQKIHSAGQHLLTLISGILDLSKIEAGRMTVFLEEFDLPTLAGEVEAMVRPLVEKNGNTFVVECPADAGVMHADLVKVRQVLFNLLSNAAKFTEAGTITLRVAREAVGGDSELSTQDSELISFAISDTGIGLTEEAIGRLFEAFSQADVSTSRKYGGTGLGLALSRQFCRLMGGDITVESEPGKGSTFTVTLPATVSDEAAAATEGTPPGGPSRA
jgi:GAF domain-containing protein